MGDRRAGIAASSVQQQQQQQQSPLLSWSFVPFSPSFPFLPLPSSPTPSPTMALTVSYFKDLLQDPYSILTSGALSATKHRDSKYDLHSYVAGAINRIPSKYQLPRHWSVWTPGQSPMSTDGQVAIAVAIYLSTLYIGSTIMKDRKPLKLARLFQIHNLLLSAGSALLLALMLQEIVPIIINDGFFNAICNRSSWTPRLETYYMVNYLFKYWELADTLFLVVKKKPLAFLHVYHHSATAVLCYTQLNGGTSISWTVIVLNLFVHVIMYYYYWATACGYKIWWKRYVTVLQISQFILDLGLVYYGTYSHFAHIYPSANLPHRGDCSGTEYAALQGCAILSSYLVLFISFYRKTYKKASDKRDIQNALKDGQKRTNGQAVKGAGRGRSESIVKAATVADSLFDETCGPAGVNNPSGSGANTPILKANGKH